MKKLTAIGLSTFFLTACQAVHVEVPTVEQQTPIYVEDRRELASVALDRVGVKIKRGTVIGSYEPDVLGLAGCMFRDSNIFWNQGRITSRDIEITDIFYHALNDANFNVVGDPNILFADSLDRKPEAEFLVGGQIEEIKLNVCDQKNIWTGGSRGTQSGKGFVKVRWQVFSAFERKVVFETTTEGTAEVTQGVADGSVMIIHEAFAAATDNLIAQQEFVDLLEGYKPTVADIEDLDAVELRFKGMPPRDAPIAESIDDLRLAVVSIDVAGTGGHGSGFFIAPNLILTNHHVVQEAEFVRVRLLTGRQIIGNVLRSHPARDVALVQVEPVGVTPMAIRETPLRIAEEVYAIGSPIDKDLSGTVTKGIVSKFLVNERGLEDIQADVDIQGGNSGGPLLDARGNVVGISYAGIGIMQRSVGVNFFIPIGDGLSKIKLERDERFTGS